jgi:hypothetical protein
MRVAGRQRIRLQLIELRGVEILQPRRELASMRGDFLPRSQRGRHRRGHIDVDDDQRACGQRIDLGQQAIIGSLEAGFLHVGRLIDIGHDSFPSSNCYRLIGGIDPRDEHEPPTTQRLCWELQANHRPSPRRE